MNFWNSFWDVIWWFLWAFVFIAYLMALFAIIGDLFRDHKLSGWWKAVWIIFLIFVPFLTALIYLIARGNGMAERSQKEAKQYQAATDAYIRQTAGSPRARPTRSRRPRPCSTPAPSASRSTTSSSPRRSRTRRRPPSSTPERGRMPRHPAPSACPLRPRAASRAEPSAGRIVPVLRRNTMIQLKMSTAAPRARPR